MARQRKKKGRPISGWLILDKPLDFGSTEAVSKIKWLFKAQKAGHAGTLDPLASGMLPIALGEATKTVPYVMEGRKVYEFTVSWGEERSTDDLEGEVTQSSDQRPTREDIEKILPDYLGEISQVPPQFSAIKIDGARAYDLAREGEKVDIPTRQVHVHRLTLTNVTEDTASFEIECGKGTYIRSLARDFGRVLGCYGHVCELRRTSVLPFSEDQMIPLSELVALEQVEDDDARLDQLDSFLIGTGEALANLPNIEVNQDQAVRIKSGNPVLIRGANAPLSADEACAMQAGHLIAIGEIANGEFHPRRVFNH